MSDFIFNPIRKDTDTPQQNTTTLMVESIPSEVAYNIFMSSIENGQSLSSDELRQRVDNRMNGTHLKIHYNDLVSYFESHYMSAHQMSDLDRISMNSISPETEEEFHRRIG